MMLVMSEHPTPAEVAAGIREWADMVKQAINQTATLNTSLIMGHLMADHGYSREQVEEMVRQVVEAIAPTGNPKGV